MRMTRPLIALAAGLFLSAACSDPESGPLRLQMSIDKAVMSVDDSLRVQLTLTNVSPLPVMVTPADAYGICFRAFEVFDPGGRPVGTEGFCIAASSVAIPAPVPLAPGAQIVITDWWRPSRSWSPDGGPLRPGTYHVRGRVGAADRVVYTGSRPVMVMD